LLTHNFLNSDRVENVLELIINTNKYVLDRLYLTETFSEELEVEPLMIIGKLETKKLYVIYC
jgi:hypothetical protein